MPLLDHFHPPVSQRRGWEGFHALWTAELVAYLNGGVLAEEFFADAQIHVGGAVEVDVAALTAADAAEPAHGSANGPATATAVAATWAPPATALVMPTVFPDDIEVRVFATAAGATLVGAVELVSPGNKDRTQTRRAFAAKCAAYLTRGIGLVVVDIVTSRLANLHNDVVELVGHGPPFVLDPAGPTYAVAYRPSRQPGGDQIELWPVPLAVGSSLPVLPLGLRNAGVVPLDLDATYREACRRSRLSPPAPR
jgi:hypothetical protein